MTLRCLIGRHRWQWFSLPDINPLGESVRISQCRDCRRIAGGWLGPDTAQTPKAAQP